MSHPNEHPHPQPAQIVRVEICGLDALLTELVKLARAAVFKLDTIEQKVEIAMLSLKEALSQINDATNSQADSLNQIAADIAALRSKIPDPADQAEADRLAGALTAQAAFSKSLAVDNADPVPTEPPVTPPAP